MALPGVQYLIVVTYFSVIGSILAQNSICSSLQFRRLGVELQNEHQCMLLEKIQVDLIDNQFSYEKHFSHLFQMISNIEMRMRKHSFGGRNAHRGLVKGFPALKGIPVARDCYELYRNGLRVSGVYPIKLAKGNVLNVWCDMTLGDSGWTVIQRRQDGSENFTRNWNDYAFGFGNSNAEYYFGNENIHQITDKGNYSLRVELTDWEGNTAYAQYDYFHIEGENKYFRLHISGYNGTAGDAFNNYHDGMEFTTIDNDNDKWTGNCALKDQSGWWFRACGFSSLNGLYSPGGKIDAVPNGFIRGIIWYHWKEDYSYSLKKTVMKIKPYVGVQMDRERAKSEAESRKRKEKERERKEEEALLEIGIHRIIGDHIYSQKKMDIS